MDLVISSFGRQRSQLTRRAKVVTVTLRSQHDNTSVQIEAVVVPFICDDIIEAPKTNKLRTVIVAEGKPLADAVVFPSVTCEPGVSLLIGSDQLWKLMPNNSEVRCDSDNRALIAIRTSMGWTLQGPSSVEEQGGQYTSSHICVLRTDVHQTEDLSYPLPRIWEVDVIGMVDEPFPKQEDVVLERFTYTIEFRNGRDKVPWKSAEYTLVDDTIVAISQKEAVERYDRTMRQHRKDRHAEEIAEDKRSEGVIREASKTRNTVGFDASLYGTGEFSCSDQLEEGVVDRDTLCAKPSLARATTSDDVRGSALLQPDKHSIHLIGNFTHRRILHGVATFAALRRKCGLLRGPQCVKKAVCERASDSDWMLHRHQHHILQKTECPDHSRFKSAASTLLGLCL
ncbi:hypothetical protein HPB52_009130 [Rhipicephalus sanguineus]|uniref:Uncharacterized protein n=1 Tax=Rhipicephalus sanguineus TaxID=34632 RepID=A0A9D4QAA2_RHISA|nr:hypothetical protein HPB52_009130 [Rhipicephalus sanguineus]